MSVKRAQQLNALGQSPKVRARMAKAGDLIVVRHGAYADAPPASALERHRRLIEGTVPLLAEAAVLSHVSAGVLHGLPSWESMLDRVTVVRRSGGHGSRRRYLYVRTVPLAASEVVEIDGLMATSLERTAVDLARSLDFERAVAVLDAALHLGGDAGVMADILAGARRRHGVKTALAADAGLPAPELQLNVFDGLGGWLARPDFCWEELGVLGEFDGQVKYRGTRDEVAQAVMQEKRREARLREIGWVVVRWDWADLGSLQTLRRRIEAAFNQARPDSIRGSVAPADLPSPTSRSRNVPLLPEFREQRHVSGAGR